MASVLVAYATKYGSTREVAEAVGEELAARGLSVDVRPAREVRDVSGYSAVVAGTAMYYFMLRGEFKRLMSRNRRDLTARPVAIFAMGPMNDTPEEIEQARGALDKYLAKAEWLKPSAVTVFGGKFDPAVLRFPDNNRFMRDMAPSDARDWDKIRGWAAGLPEMLGVEP